MPNSGIPSRSTQQHLSWRRESEQLVQTMPSNDRRRISQCCPECRVPEEFASGEREEVLHILVRSVGQKEAGGQEF